MFLMPTNQVRKMNISDLNYIGIVAKTNQVRGGIETSASASAVTFEPDTVVSSTASSTATGDSSSSTALATIGTDTLSAFSTITFEVI